MEASEQEKPRKTTEYVLLVEGANEGEWFEQVGSTSAGSAKAAIKKYAEAAGGDEGTYVAIPKRSFQKHTIEVRTTTRASFASGDSERM